MSYTPTTWVNGDTITAVKLNKIEQGIADAGSGGGGGALIVHDESATLDTTWQDIWDAASTGLVAISIVSSTEIDFDLVTAIIKDESDPNDPYYGVNTSSGAMYSTTTPNGYPADSNA